jgi:ADP-ribose pyrophosphatase YjhB (NUDIX family)
MESSQHISPGSDLYYAKKSGDPHLSVGVVLVDDLDPDRARVAFLYSPPELENPWGIRDFKCLIHETVDDEESLPRAVHRGMEEEMGVRGSIVKMLTTMVVRLSYRDMVINKATVYHLAQATELGGPREMGDIEGHLPIVWQPFDEAIDEQTRQAIRPDLVNRPDLHEREPLILAQRHLARLALRHS